MANHLRAPRLAVAVVVIGCMVVLDLHAQTAIKLAKNRYTPQQDVELGKKGAAEVRQQFPIIENERIARYLTGIGDRLVAAAPPGLKEPVYEYSFTAVNLKEINAFALPGGPMFVHRGMFDAAEAEAEVTGVMAHELAHVLLRHGTANASKAQNPWMQIGQLAGMIGGSVIGGAAGSAIAQGSQFGLGTLLLRYSRDFEKQADLLGAQVMARAGYDPRSLAHMFETIEKQSQSGGGGGSPQWMSSHPNPGNRTQYIRKEAEMLSIVNAADTSEFVPIKSVFASLPPAKSMSEGAIKAVPQNGYGPLNGQTVFTHGVEFGVLKAAAKDLREATSQPLLARRGGAHRPVHDFPGRWKFVLLPHGRSGERRRGIPAGISAGRTIDSVHGRALTRPDSAAAMTRAIRV